VIRLRIEEYCNECPNFEPAIKKRIFKDDCGDIYDVNTVINCENREVCRLLKSYLQRQINEKEKTK
jgi:t-SNARE complex subunit (syntaxin)